MKNKKRIEKLQCLMCGWSGSRSDLFTVSKDKNGYELNDNEIYGSDEEDIDETRVCPDCKSDNLVADLDYLAEKNERNISALRKQVKGLSETITILSEVLDHTLGQSFNKFAKDIFNEAVEKQEIIFEAGRVIILKDFVPDAVEYKMKYGKIIKVNKKTVVITLGGGESFTLDKADKIIYSTLDI